MIKLTDVSKIYKIDGEIFKALDSVSMEIKNREFLAIQGPSGSGKSTLMHIIGLLDLPTEGTVKINNTNISIYSDDQLSKLRNEFVGFVFQQFNLINKLNVVENIMLPTLYCRSALNFNPYEKTISLIDRFGLKGKEKSYPNKLSGGQQQRVAIARALVMSPQLLLADEPTGNLDTKTGNSIMDLITGLNQDNKMTVVVITHDSEVAARAKRVVHIRDGRIE